MPKGQRENTVLFTDDFSRSGIRPEALERLFRTLLRVSLGNLARSELGKGSMLVSGEEGLPVPSGVGSRSYGTIMIQGVTGTSAAELVRMIGLILKAIQPACRLRSKSGVSAADVLSFRHFATFLQEYVLRSVAPLDHFLARSKAGRVLVTSSGSALESTARYLARKRGLAVETVPAPAALRLAAWLKARLSRRRLTPDYEAISALWASVPEESAAPADVLIVCEEERRLDRAAELLELAEGRGRILTVPFKAEARRKAEAMRAGGLSVSFLPGFLGAADRERILPLAIGDGEAAWAALEKAGEVRDCSFLGVPVWEIFSQRMNVGWDSLSLVAALSVAAAEECLDRVGPKRVVVVDNGIYSKAMQAVARARGIPVLWYADNPILCNTVYWPELLGAFFPFDGVIASSAFIAKSMREKFGFPPEQVFLAGSPEKDTGGASPISFPGQGRGKVLSLSTYVTMDVSAETRKRFHLLVAEAARIAGLDLVVRAHPNEALEGLRRDLEAWGVKPVHLSQKENVQEVLAGVDMACMIFSQAGLEVLRAGKPLVLVQGEEVREGYEAFVPYATSGAAFALDPGSQSAEELAARLTSLLAGPGREEALRLGQEFFREYSTAKRDPGEMARLRAYLLPS